jgi:hypothetical protein
MIRADVASLCMAMWRFERLRLTWEQYYTNRSVQLSLMDPNHRAVFDSHLSDYKGAVANLHLNPVEDRLKKIDLRCSWHHTTVGDMCVELTMLCETTIDELKRHIFIHVPAEKVRFAESPKEFFSSSWDAYPSAREDMEAACRCYALGENTAAVFHSMIVLQAGLERFAEYLGLSFPGGNQFQQWGSILVEIMKEVEQRHKKAQQLPNAQGQAKQEELQFFADTGMQFSFFKDAWRNRVAHGREKYTDDSALTILASVKNFMLTLSKRVREEP